MKGLQNFLSKAEWLDNLLAQFKVSCFADHTFISFFDSGSLNTYLSISKSWITWPLRNSLCQFTLQSDDIFFVNPINKYNQFSGHPLLDPPYSAQSYTGLAIRDINGKEIGTIFYTRNNDFENRSSDIQSLKYFRNAVEEKIQLYLITNQVRKYENHQVSLERARDLFLSSISHEVRTPLNAIIGIGEWLSSEDKNSERNTQYQQLKEASNHLLFLVNQIFDFNILESGDVKVDNIAFQMTDILQYLEKLLSHKAQSKSLELKLEVDADVPQSLIGDVFKLRQILLYLLDNGIKYTQKGSVSLKVSLIRNLKEACLLSFQVEDTGVGIHKEDIEEIFRPFNKVNKIGEYRQYDGAGLGLPITQKLIEVLSSRLDIQSIPERGSVFRFNLLIGTDKIPFEVEVEPTPQDQDQNLKGIRILLVEDNPINAMIAKKFLDKWGAVVHIVRNGKAAVDHLQTHVNTYDLLLMDIQMPVMNGLEASRHIRNTLGIDKETLPIISFTASILQDSFNVSIEAGMNDCITKPFNPQELFDKISRLVRKKKV
jgi:signal transduction histidine kinase/CheY-like chemotaxis protein